MVTKKESVDVAETTKTNYVKIEKWAAVAGRWKISKSEAKYLGQEKPSNGRSPIGIALGPRRFRDGTIRTSFKLERDTNTAAGLVIGYQSLKSRYLIVQLGGWETAYSIAEFLPEAGFVNRASVGSLLNLSIDQPHSLEVCVEGQKIEVTVDEIDVLHHVVSQPIEGTGFGLYAYGEAAVDFGETTIKNEVPRIFVIMPFKEPFDTLYREVIFPVATEEGFGVIRVDEIFGLGIILNDIQQQIEKAQAVVAEISAHHPNVFYELGYAHALRKPSVLLVRRQEGAAMPFDVRGFRAIFYDDTIGGKKTVETNLRQHLKAIRDS